MQRRSEGPGQEVTIRPGREEPPEPSPLATPKPVPAASSTINVEQRSRARAASLLASTGRTRCTRSQADEIDGLEQGRDNALPATLRSRMRNEDEATKIDPQFGCCCEPERRETDHGAPVSPRRHSCEQGEQQARQTRTRASCGCAIRWRRSEQDRATSREPTAREQCCQFRKNGQNSLARQRGCLAGT